MMNEPEDDENGITLADVPEETPSEPAKESELALPELSEMGLPVDGMNAEAETDNVETKSAEDLAAVFDIPVKVSAVLGRSRMEISDLLKLGVGTVIELDRKVGEAIDVYVNDRLVARGEVVLVEDKLGITMTEIIKTEK